MGWIKLKGERYCAQRCDAQPCCGPFPCKRRAQFVLESPFTLAVLRRGGGYQIKAVGYSDLFLVAAGLAAAGALLFWAYFRVPRADPVRSAALAPMV